MKDKSAWSYYWQEKHLDSCIAASQQHDQQILIELWQNFVNDDAPGSKVLDLATGNGSVLSAIANSRNDLSLCGVDYAAISPDSSIKEKVAGDVSFIGKTDICDLPFEDSSFDIVCSQFGFEYADLMPAVQELNRVLKINGRCQLIVHHPESEILKSSKNRLQELMWLVEPQGLLNCVQSYLACDITAEMVDAFGQNYIHKYAGKLSKSVTGQIYQVIGDVIALKEEQNNLHQAKLLSNNIAERVDAEISRLKQLMSAAMNAEDVKQLTSMLDLDSDTVKIELLAPHDAPDLIFGWVLNGTKVKAAKC